MSEPRSTIAEISHVLTDPDAPTLSAEQWAAMYSKLWAAHDEALARIEWLKMTLPTRGGRISLAGPGRCASHCFSRWQVRGVLDFSGL
jgi:hypothetical protein